MKKYFLIFFLIIFYACAAPHPVTQIETLEPESYVIPEHTNFVYKQSKNKTWNEIVNKFSGAHFFTINSIDNDAQHLTATFEGTPELYLDCGHRVIQTNGRSSTVVHAKKNYKYSSYRKNHLDTFFIRNKFSGIVNIFLNGNKHTSTVIVQIVFNLNVLEVLRSTQGGQNRNRDYAFTINPNELKFFDLFNASCRSKGKLEMQIKTLLKG